MMMEIENLLGNVYLMLQKYLKYLKILVKGMYIY